MLGSRGEADEGLSLLGLYVMFSGRYVPTSQTGHCASTCPLFPWTQL